MCGIGAIKCVHVVSVGRPVFEQAADDPGWNGQNFWGKGVNGHEDARRGQAEIAGSGGDRSTYLCSIGITKTRKLEITEANATGGDRRPMSAVANPRPPAEQALLA
jgi:hypothetical protein